MQTIGVIGLGNWGTALGNHLARKGLDVLGWCIEPEIAQGINNSHKNPVFLKDADLHTGLRATNRLEEVLGFDTTVLVVPAHVLAQVVPNLRLKPGSTLVSAVKGIEEHELLTPLQYAAKNLPASVELAVLSGPSFAKDVVIGNPCGVVAAARNEKCAEQVADLFTSSRMRVYVSTDPLGVELGGLVKNVIAIAAGACDALGLSESARAGLITRGLAEMMRLARVMGADVQTLTGLSGLGDLMMTATSEKSRNRTVGLRLGRGEPLDHILKTLGSVAEGVHSTPLVLALAARHKVEMPICQQVSRLIKGEATAQQIMEIFMARPRTRELNY